jgi:translation elongation factor EF-G
LRQALAKAGPVLLGPPPDCAAAVIRDLQSRQGHMQVPDVGGDATIRAAAPLANMFDYANTLRSLSRSRASFTMRFDRFTPVPFPDDDPPFGPAVGMRA